HDALNTTGRNASDCGQIAHTVSPSIPGETIGPPAARLYAVDPDGVATITPSPAKVIALVPDCLGSIASSSSMMRNGGPALTTASFIAIARNTGSATTSSVLPSSPLPPHSGAPGA